MADKFNILDVFNIPAKSVGLASFADQVDGSILTWDAAAAAALIGPGLGTEFVGGNGAGAPTSFKVPGGGGGGAFTKSENIVTSGDISVTALAFTDITGAVTPSITPSAGETILVYAVLSIEGPAGADKLAIDILHDNSGAFVSIFGTTNGIIFVERDDHSACYAFPVTLPAAVATVFKLQGKVVAAGTGMIHADAAGEPLVMGTLRV